MLSNSIKNKSIFKGGKMVERKINMLIIGSITFLYKH
jgi:hypothetical protein